MYLTGAIPALGGQDFVMAIGANHTRTGKAKYTNLSILKSSLYLSLGGLADDDLTGSMAYHLKKLFPLRFQQEISTYGDQIFILKLARSCAAGEKYCLQVPYPTLQDHGIYPLEPWAVVTRGYRDPLLPTLGPHDDEVLAPTYLHVSPQ